MIQRPEKLDALTSLRFIAAAMIVIGHAHPVFGSWGLANAAPLDQGVSFFFILSGFILAYNYPSLGDASAVRAFWLARFARVWPLHAITCFLWIALVFKFERQVYFPGFDGILRLAANLFLVQSWIPLTSWAVSFNGVSWSLSAEFFFYAMFPFLISRWLKSWHWILLVQFSIVVSIIALAGYYSLPGDDAAGRVGLEGIIYFNPAVRLLEFSVGISIAFGVRKFAESQVRLSGPQWLVLELLACVACTIALLAAANFSGIQNVLGQAFAYYFRREGLWLLFATMIAVFALSRGPIASILSTKALVFLGEISFALYLCHAIIIHYIFPYADRIRAYGGFGYIAFWSLLVVVSAALFIGVEKPARQLILGYSTRRIKTSGGSRTERAYSTKACIAVAFLIVSSACAGLYRPSMLETVDEKFVESFLADSGTKAISPGAKFDKRYSVLAMRHRTLSDEKVSIELLMKADEDLIATDVLALHSNGVGNVIISALGDVLLDSAAARTRAGTRWVQRFTMTTQQFAQTKSFGLAMYSNPNSLFDVRGSATDWNGKRLILPK